MNSVGQTIFAFFEDYLKAQKGLRPGSIRSYRDTLKLFLVHVRDHLSATDYAVAPCRPVLRTSLGLPAYDRVHAQESCEYSESAACCPAYLLSVSRRPSSRDAGRSRTRGSDTLEAHFAPQTHYLERDEIEDLFQTLPKQGDLALRDRALFMILYNTGARVQEVADLSVADVDLDGPLRRTATWEGRQVAKLPRCGRKRPNC